MLTAEVEDTIAGEGQGGSVIPRGSKHILPAPSSPLRPHHWPNSETEVRGLPPAVRSSADYISPRALRHPSPQPRPAHAAVPRGPRPSLVKRLEAVTIIYAAPTLRFAKGVRHHNPTLDPGPDRACEVPSAFALLPASGYRVPERTRSQIYLPRRVPSTHEIPTAARGWLGVLRAKGLGWASKPRSGRLQLPGGTAAAAARHSGTAHGPGKWRGRGRGRGSGRGRGGGRGDPEAGAKDGVRPANPRVRKPRGAPPRPGRGGRPTAPPLPPRPAVVTRDAEPGAAGGASRGERRRGGGCLLPSPSSPTGGPRKEFGSRAARPSERPDV